MAERRVLSSRKRRLLRQADSLTRLFHNHGWQARCRRSPADGGVLVHVVVADLDLVIRFADAPPALESRDVEVGSWGGATARTPDQAFAAALGIVRDRGIDPDAVRHMARKNWWDTPWIADRASLQS